MGNLLKSEIAYNKNIITALFSLPLLYTLFLILDIGLFETSRFWGKYFWPAMIGLGTYLMMYILWAQRLKEKRDRLHSLIPISIKENAFSRILIGLLPLGLILLYLLIIHLLFFTDKIEQVVRIFAQLGFMFIFLVLMLIWRDLWCIFLYKSESRKLFFVGVFAILMTVSTIGIIFFVLIPFFDEMFLMSHEAVFFLWGLILCLLADWIFRKGKNYTQ